MKSIFTLFILLFWFLGYSQEKIEHEVSISSKKVPTKALAFIDKAFPNHPKIHWYLEYGKNEIQYESKFEYKKHWYSIEFDTLGSLIDVEVKVDWNEVPKEIQNKISQNLKTTYPKFKILKIQEQLKGDESFVLNVLLEDNKTHFTSLITAYELKIKAKNKEGYFIFEHLYDKNGELISVQKIIQPNTDFLEY